MQKALVLGRQGDIKLSDDSVSRRHAKLTKEGESLVIEDLGSTYGTFVNGEQIKKKAISLSDEVVLGSHKINVQELIPQMMSEAEYATAFGELKGAWERFIAEQTAIKRKQRNLAMMKFAPAAVISLISISIGKSSGSLPVWATMIITLLGGGGGMLVGQFLAAKPLEKLDTKHAELMRKIQREYVCPRCKIIFGQIPFEELLQQKECPKCKSKFEIA